MSANHGEIVAALVPYFDGFYEGDIDKLKSIFHPACHLYSAPGGELMDSDMTAVYTRVGGRTRPSERGDTKEDDIITIDQSGEDCAFAKVMIALGENRFTDYLTLLKLDGRWQIIGKTFTAVPRPGVEPL
jgi:putative lumazine-binding protein